MGGVEGDLFSRTPTTNITKESHMSHYGRKLKCDDASTMSEVVENFLSEKPHKTVFGNFRITGDKLIYSCQTQKELAGGTDIERARLVKNVRSGEFELVSPVDASKVMAKSDGKNWSHYRLTYKVTETEVIAVKIKRKGELPFVLGNSSVLKLIGRTVAYGNVNLNRGVTEIQKVLETKVRMIPFSVFAEANLDLQKVRIVDQGGAEAVTRRVLAERGYGGSSNKFRDEEVHFTGSSLFEVSGRYFLMDLDRKELKHKLFNVFLTEMPKKVSSVAEAYVALKPKEVLEAERKGIPVLRQGEFFFIESKAPKLPKLSGTDKALALVGERSLFKEEEKILSQFLGKKFVKAAIKKAQQIRESIPKPLKLTAGTSRAHEVSMGVQINGLTYVTRKVTHSGREHREITLSRWHVAVPNTAAKSFTISGDVD